MSIEVTLSLQEDLYEDVKRWAALNQQDLSDVITYALTIVLNRVHAAPKPEPPVSSLSDEEVLARSRAQRNSLRGRRLTTLLEKQRQGLLTEGERPELHALMHSCSGLWSRHEEALTEAIRRGLRPPLDQ